MPKVNKSTAEHYKWGESCDGWHFVNNSNLSVISEIMPSGTSEKMHYHNKSMQFFYILKGTAEMLIDNKINILNSGDGIEIPAGVKHKISNSGKDNLEFLVISSPHSHGDRVEI